MSNDDTKRRLDEHETRIAKLEETVGDPVELEELPRRPSLQEQFESFRVRLDRLGVTRRKVPGR